MKKQYFIIIVLGILINFPNYAQKKKKRDTDSWKDQWTEFQPNLIDYPKATDTLPKIINKDLHLHSFNTYLVSGNTYVTNNAKLSVGAGTILRFETVNKGNLIITQGSKLMVLGSQNKPVIFTSNKEKGERASGDWGGVYILGNGKLYTDKKRDILTKAFPDQNLDYGSNQSNEESTVLTNLRIEFAGSPNAEDVNGSALSIYAPGSSSLVENVMVSFSAGDSFTVVSGKCNFNKLISFKSKDDDFQLYDGFSGGITEGLVIKDPIFSDFSEAFPIEAEGNASGTETENFASFRNMIFASTRLPNSENAYPCVLLKNSAKVNLFDSTISGFTDVVKFDSSYTTEKDIRSSFSVNNSLINIKDEGMLIANDIETKFLQSVLIYNNYTNRFASYDQLFRNTTPETLNSIVLDELFVNASNVSGMD